MTPTSDSAIHTATPPPQMAARPTRRGADGPSVDSDRAIARPRSSWRFSVSRLPAIRSLPARALVRVQSAGASPDAGMTTAEYAVGTVAACGFGGVLWKVVTSPQVLDLITGVISRAFKLSF